MTSLSEWINHRATPTSLFVAGASIVVFSWLLMPFNPASWFYSVLISGLSIIVGYRWGVTIGFTFLSAFMLLPNCISSYVFEEELPKSLLYTIGPGIIFYGQCRRYSSCRPVAYTLAAITLPIIMVAIALGVYAYNTWAVDGGLGQGMAILFIAIFTLSLTLFLEFIYFLHKCTGSRQILHFEKKSELPNSPRTK